jgi:hypothetical protein
MKEINPSGRLNYIMNLQRQNDIIAMLLEGKEVKDIRAYIVKRYNITVGTTNIVIHKASQEIKNREAWELDNLISIHIERYDDIYKKLYELGAYGNATNALRAKEKLMGFHREGFHMKVTEGEIQQLRLKNVDNEYSVEKLPVEKKNRLQELLDKAKDKK